MKLNYKRFLILLFLAVISFFLIPIGYSIVISGLVLTYGVIIYEPFHKPREKKVEQEKVKPVAAEAKPEPKQEPIKVVPVKGNYTVYLITNTKSDKAYVDITDNYEETRFNHFDRPFRNLDKHKKLYIAMNSIGEHLFNMEIVQSGLSKQDAEDLKAKLIFNLGTGYPKGYNEV
jgi:hypothetical protein